MDPAYAKIRDELLAELNAWRKEINDQGVTESFREGGWPADYPTRTLEEWEYILGQWEPWVFRGPGENDRSLHPEIRQIHEELK